MAGVCAGLARRFGMSPFVVRVLFVLSMLLPGPQILVYIALWIIAPDERGRGRLVIGRRRPLKATAALWAARSLFEHGRERWDRLTPDEQGELRRLLTTSRGRRRNLSEAEQLELRRLFRKAGGKDGDPRRGYPPR